MQHFRDRIPRECFSGGVLDDRVRIVQGRLDELQPARIPERPQRRQDVRPLGRVKPIAFAQHRGVLGSAQRGQRVDGGQADVRVRIVQPGRDAIDRIVGRELRQYVDGKLARVRIVDVHVGRSA